MSPINVDVYINERRIKQYRIGRSEPGYMGPDDINTYHILEFFEGNEETKVWSEAPSFQHRYGDGVDVCIKKGLEALLNAN